MDWRWNAATKGFRDYAIEFTIHNDVGNWSDQHGYYLILMQNRISDTGLYFGLQTNVQGLGKGVLFSRWGTRDLANAMHSPKDGWTQSSGHEGDFIGVRRSYDWGAGDYRVRIAPDGLESDGEWFSLWITDLGSGDTTWIGSLKFPLLDGTAALQTRSSATIELYGTGPIRPIDIPQWHVSLKRPSGDNVFALSGFTTYPSDDQMNALPNSNVRYDETEDRAHLIVGGTTERKDPAVRLSFMAIPDRVAIPVPPRTPTSTPTPTPTPTPSPTPTPTPKLTPTPTPTPTARPSLPSIRPDVAAVLATRNAQREEIIRDIVDQFRVSRPKLAAKIRNLRWIRDGIRPDDVWIDEYRAAISLFHLAELGHTDFLVGQPWVVSGENYATLLSLSEAGGRPEELDMIMSLPRVEDGITGHEAKLLATLNYPPDPEAAKTLLDPALLTIEEKTISLPLAGDTELAIIRDSPGHDQTMDSLEQSVRSIEEFMGIPFPVSQVIFRFQEIPIFGGLNNITHVKMGVNETAISVEQLLILMAHEAAHYYWRGFAAPWMVEGAATFLSSVANDTLQGQTFEAPCTAARTLAELEALYVNQAAGWSEVNVCNYSLGERLFRDLYRNMDDTTFRLAFRRLLLKLFDDCGTANEPTCFFEDAFAAYVPEEALPTIKNVIARWYDGTEPYDLSRTIGTPVEPDLPAIGGRIDEAYVSLSGNGPPAVNIQVAPGQRPILFLALEYSYENTASLTSLPVEIAVSFEDGFEFNRIQEELPLPVGTANTHHFHVTSSSAIGRYWLQVYWEGQKIAEATFETVPTVAYSVGGTVTNTDGAPPQGISLWLKREGEEYLVGPNSEGEYEIDIPSGAFVMEIWAVIGRTNFFLGWYDGAAGITTSPNDAFDVVVEGASVEGVDIMLPAELESLLCPSGSQRSKITGRCP